MQPLQELLHRIRWDAEFGRGEFSIAYVDRVAGGEVTVPLADTEVDAAGRRIIVRTESGRTVRIPMHRVRRVIKDGVPIWQRPDPEQGSPTEDG